MEKRTCIITGGNSGIGFDVAKRLVCHNYDVVLACRNQTKAAGAVDQIKLQYPEASISYMLLDLSFKESVFRFVQTFKESKKKLQLLINNAGIKFYFDLIIFNSYWLFFNYFIKTSFFDILISGMWPKSISFTVDNLEETFQTNHLGPFYLTLLLLEELKKNSPSRIIMVSSCLHDPNINFKLGGPDTHLDFDNLMLTEKEGTFTPVLAYKNSKLANILFAKELSKRLPPNSGVTINSMDPGWIPMTGLLRASNFVKCILGCCFGCCFTKTASLESCSNCLVYLSCSDTLEDVTGKYFVQCREVPSSAESNDESVAARLWDFSIKLLDVEDDQCVKQLVK